ncbi:MAG TPA: diaminopimelate decarboxylase [Thermomicrobiales bacterium]|nr:diaminopimelate decarboxylase [Thermomicrobiales bacterium]
MLWPETTKRNDAGELTIGGISVTELAERFGTPLYIFDEVTLRNRARRAVASAFAGGPGSRAVFASKALELPVILAMLAEEGLGIDVVSGGELFVALKSGIDPHVITFHGNNKSEQELREAIDAGIELIAVDNLYELDLLEGLTAGRTTPVSILLRVNPGIDVHTHDKIATGVLDSKFGFPLWTNDAETAVVRTLEIPGIALKGFHSHLGSQLFDEKAAELAIEKIVAFAAEMRRNYGVETAIVSPGGGMGISYLEGMPEMDVAEWMGATADALERSCALARIPHPSLVFEPGRWIVGPAGVALYRTGSRREIDGVRTYVSVDGGMADNIRPALYDAAYTAALANRNVDDVTETVTIAGKYCESGDVLIRDIDLPQLEPGDLLAVPAAGAYCIPMASNYNLALKPAVVLVCEGQARLIRRRETYDDLLALDTLPGS